MHSKAFQKSSPPPSCLYPPHEIILALIPSLSLSLCSVTHKYVTHALKGINSHFLSCLTQIRRRNCLESNGYEMDF